MYTYSIMRHYNYILSQYTMHTNIDRYTPNTVCVYTAAISYVCIYIYIYIYAYMYI